MTNTSSPQEEPSHGTPGSVPTIDELLIRLTDADPAVRSQAAIDLRRLPDSRAIQALLIAANDPDPAVRFEASVTLDQIPFPPDIPFLFQLASQPNSNKEPIEAPEQEAWLAYQALSLVWLPAITYLASALVDPDPTVRRCVASNLGAHIYFLTPTATTSATPEEDMATMRALLFPAIRQALHDDDAGIRLECIEAFRQKFFPAEDVIGVLLPCLRDTNAGVRKRTAILLHHYYHAPLEALRPYLQDELASARAAAIGAVPRQFDDSVVDTLVAACRDSAPEVRLAAASVISEHFKAIIDSPTALPVDRRLMITFEQLFGDDNDEVQHLLDEYLRQCWHQVMVNRYLAQLRSPDPSIRQKAMEVVKELHDCFIDDNLKSLFRDSDSQLRLVALTLLLQIKHCWTNKGGKEREPNITTRDWATGLALRDRDARIRIMAIDHIIQQRKAKFFENLIACIEDPDAEVAQHAKDGVLMFRQLLSVQTLTEMLHSTQTVTRQEAAELTQYAKDPQRNELLHLALHDADDKVRGTAISLVRRAADREFIPDLIALIKHEDSSTSQDRLVRNAIIALGEIGDKCVIPFLISLLRHPGRARIYAHFALEVITGLPRSKDLLVWEAWWAKQTSGK